MTNKAPAPMSNSYCPEIDISFELNTTDASYYQSLISILQWMVELGRVEITTEVSIPIVEINVLCLAIINCCEY